MSVSPLAQSQPSDPTYGPPFEDARGGTVTLRQVDAAGERFAQLLYRQPGDLCASRGPVLDRDVAEQLADALLAYLDDEEHGT